MALGAGVPFQITLETAAPRLPLTPYIDFLDRRFATLAPRERGETPVAYIDRHLQMYGQQWPWHATVTVFERRELEANPPNTYCGHDMTPAPEPVQVIAVYDDNESYFDISETVATLEFWCPRLAGSLLSTFQQASHILQVWGPVEAVENPMGFYDERDYWGNMYDEALGYYTHRRDEAAAPRRQGAAPVKAPPITHITNAEFKAFLREQSYRTPGQLKREVGQATFNAAKYPLTREQLSALADDPVTSPVQAEALRAFLDRCDRIRSTHEALMARSDEEVYANIQPEEEYVHHQFILETQLRDDDDRPGAVYEMLREYMDYQYNGGCQARYLYATQTTLGDELSEVLTLLQTLYDLFMAQCTLLQNWPETGVTAEMRQAHRGLKPPKRRTR